MSSESILEGIVEANLQLVDVRGRSSDDLMGHWCRIDWTEHKNDPSSTPMFRDVVGHSEDCTNPYKYPLAKAFEAVKEYDEDETDNVNVMSLGGVVFHESRCGSTLVANMLQSISPQKHRVYSESPPPIAALRNVCGEDYSACSIETAAETLRQVVYLMSRSNQKEERVFFKIQSIGSRNIPVFLKAFPQTPWLFIYRHPVQVLQSQLAHGIRNANCARQQRSGNHSPAVRQALLQARALSPDANIPEHPRDLTPVEYCALHLASITTTAAQHVNENGHVINYSRLLTDDFTTWILPDFLEREPTSTEIASLEATSQVYSKGRGNKAGEFHADSQAKMATASADVVRAAALFLENNYQQLERESEAQQ